MYIVNQKHNAIINVNRLTIINQAADVIIAGAGKRDVLLGAYVDEGRAAEVLNMIISWLSYETSEDSDYWESQRPVFYMPDE